MFLACFSWLSRCLVVGLPLPDSSLLGRNRKVLPKDRVLKAPNYDADWFGCHAAGFIFRPIHYLGSKLRVLGAIERAIDRVDPSLGPVCDLFSGSSTVSRYLSRRRRVLAVDIQEYARVLADAVLNGDSRWSVSAVEESLLTDNRGAKLRAAIAPLAGLEADIAQAALQGDLEPLCTMLEVGSLASLNANVLQDCSRLGSATARVQKSIKRLGLPDSDTVCIRHFGGQYFSYSQSAELDVLAAFSRRTDSSLILAATLSTASHLVNSIGKQFAQPIRPRDKSGTPKRHIVKKIIAERSTSARAVFLNYVRQYTTLSRRRRDHLALRADFREALSNLPFKPSVIYADPPYTRDHYSRFYHALETLSLGDDPSITTSNLGGGTMKSRGGYRAGRHQSPFCIKSEAPTAFSTLFSAVAALRIPLVLSYSGYDPSVEARPRVMPLQCVVDLAREHFANVEVEELSNLDHMKLNAVQLNKAARGTTEVLLICR